MSLYGNRFTIPKLIVTISAHFLIKEPDHERKGSTMDIAILKANGIEFLLRWAHFLFGITWIGVLYYFNFIQGSWFQETESQHKNAAVQKLVPRALWWFRWGAMGTFLTGLAILHMKAHGGAGVFKTSYGVFILTGALMGLFMFLNVWLIIWPSQKKVIASANQEAEGKGPLPEAAKAGARAALASRTNTLFSFPMLFFMGAASHLPMAVTSTTNMTGLAAALGGIIGILEINAYTQRSIYECSVTFNVSECFLY